MMEQLLVYVAMVLLSGLFWFKELLAPTFLSQLTTNEILSLLIVILVGQFISTEIHHSSFRRKTLADKDAMIADLRQQRDEWRAQAQIAIEPSIKYFPPSSKPFNEPFYDYFCDKIVNAKNSIYVVGMGFASVEYASSIGHRVIRNYNDATKRALRKDVTVVRIQTRNNISPEWAKMLRDLLDEFPTHFKLYYCPISDIDIVTFSVIDPDIADECVVEMLMSSNHLWVKGERPASADFTAMFIMNNIRLAESFQKEAFEMISSHQSVHIKNSAMIDELLVTPVAERAITAPGPRTILQRLSSGVSVHRPRS